MFSFEAAIREKKKQKRAVAGCPAELSKIFVSESKAKRKSISV
jgi:hypothetical protein